MVKILFVCHGNICRSPMAEFIMKDLVKKEGLEDRFLIESAAVSSEELGNPVYPPAVRKLAEHGIGCKGKRARQMTAEDYNRFDMIILMDKSNLRNAKPIINNDSQGKITLLMEHAGSARDVADPWYTGDFDITYSDILKGCKALLEEIKPSLL